tara:strand:- start:432 stop:593 length:162 start_codon:yes stop_codon:yes gene_type:complete
LLDVLHDAVRRPLHQVIFLRLTNNNGFMVNPVGGSMLIGMVLSSPLAMKTAFR